VHGSLTCAFWTSVGRHSVLFVTRDVWMLYGTGKNTAFLGKIESWSGRSKGIYSMRKATVRFFEPLIEFSDAINDAPTIGRTAAAGSNQSPLNSVP